MKWEHQPWRKLYVHEPTAQKLMALMARGLRDYLIRFADEDGVLFRQTNDPVEDLTRVLSPRDIERDMSRDAVRTLLDDGYLEHTRQGSLVIRNFIEAQNRKTPEAARKAAQRAREKGEANPSDSHGTVTGQVRRIDPIRNESKRIEETAPQAAPKRGERLPEGWSPKPGSYAGVQVKRGLTDRQVSEALEAFRDYWQAKAGQGGCKLDWDATFRTWLRRTERQSGKWPSRPPPANTGITYKDFTYEQGELPSERTRGLKRIGGT